MKLLALTFTLATTSIISTASTIAPLQTQPALVGFEDIRGLVGSDRDFNDIEILVTGVRFTLTDPFVFAGYPSGFGIETPFPDGYFFSEAIAIGNLVTATLLSQQSAIDGAASMKNQDGTVHGMISVGIPKGGVTVSLITQPGDRILFMDRVEPIPTDGSIPLIWYSNRLFDVDGLDHAVVAFPTPDTRTADTPEPGTLTLLLPLGLTLLVVGIVSKRRQAKPIAQVAQVTRVVVAQVASVRNFS